MREAFDRWAYKMLYRYMCRCMEKRDQIKRRQLRIQRRMEAIALRYPPSRTPPEQRIGF